MKRAFCLGVLLCFSCSPTPPDEQGASPETTQVEREASPQSPQVAGEILVETLVDTRTQQVVEEYEYYIHAEDGHQVRHGFYRSYHRDGKPLQTGYFKFGRKDGEWTYQQGDIKRLGTFSDDQLVGTYKYYDGSGRKIREGT